MPETYRIFAYGSLINQASLRRTVPEARNIIPVKTYGLRRVFNLASTYRFDPNHKAPVCVLSAETGAEEDVLNGTSFEMDEVSLADLLERESGYDFCRIEALHYHDDREKFEAYYFRAKQSEPYQFLPKSKEQNHYLQLCLSGSSVFGQEFVEDFKKSTSFWGIECKRELDLIWNGEY